MAETEPQTQRTTPEQITADVLASFDGCGDDRLREIMQALVRHLHGFVSEVKLTPAEWTGAIEMLTRTGHITDQHRQEFVLWSDSLGASMLVDSLQNTLPAGATESTVLGPFYVAGSPLREYGANIAEEGDAGVPALVHGHVRDTRGAPIADAELDVWQNGDDRLYAVQRPEGPEDHLRGRFLTRSDGSYAFVAVRPVPYPIPYDGPVGQML
jgi:hydroxyquinol 1,2-dioxygenase